MTYTVEPPAPSQNSLNSPLPPLQGMTVTQVGERKNKMIPIYITLVVLLILGVFAVSSSLQKRGPAFNPGKLRPSIPPTLIPYPTQGAMMMKTKDGEKRYAVGSPVTVVIQANSEGKRIVGYDAILSYDNKGFSYQSSKSLSPDFQLYAYDRKTYVSFSGIRSLQSTSIDSWTSYPLLEVVLMPKQKGSYAFELSPEGKETSKLVDDKAQVVYPKTEQLLLEIY